MNQPREGSAIIADLYALTNRMVEQRHDADFLIEGVEGRQALIEEYERFAAANPEQKAILEQDPAARQTIAKILDMDKVITKALGEFKQQVQKDVASLNAQQKVLFYMGGTHQGATGNRMDYKK